MNYRIDYTRNDLTKLDWKEWAWGLPNFVTAEREKQKLVERNKDFDFKVEKDNRTP